MKKIYAFLSAVLLTSSLFSQSPQSFSYQAVVRGSNNELVANKQVGMKISLLQGSEYGSPVYIETHSPTSNLNGLVSVAIGNGIKLVGDFVSIDWAKGPYFVKTETDPTGGTNYVLVGTTQLLSVPYALYAANSQPGPKGDKGDQGIQGPIGLTGPQGESGAVGPQGLPGKDGVDGKEGIQGPIGLTGPKGDKGDTGIPGVNGLNTLVKSLPEPIGLNCLNGGVKLEYGLDLDKDGILDDGEINASLTQYVCNGIAGQKGENGSFPSGNHLGEMNFWNGTNWVALAPGSNGQGLSICDGVPTWTTNGICPGKIASINCQDAINTGSLIVNQNANSVSSVVSYSGGNGGNYSSISVNSTGVLGLTAVLNQGVFVNGTGNLTFSINGTPTSAGTATFNIVIAGKTCSLTRNISLPEASLSALNCNSALHTGSLVVGTAASSVNSDIPYSGANGGTYINQSINSTGVLGLKAELVSGTLSNGAGNLNVIISGTPNTSGTASFEINIGGKTCTLTRNVNASTYIVTLDPNGGSVSTTSLTVTFGSAYGTLPTPTKTGYTFTRWKLNGDNITATTNVYLRANHTLVAQWTANNYLVTLDPNGGNVSTTSQTVTFGSAYGTLPTPTKDGYTFAGWSFNGTSITATTLVTQAANHTLVAQWVELIGSINIIDCGSATNNGTLTANTPASGVYSVIAYTGGNGASHQGQTISSTGVTGLTATLAAGTFANGNGSLTYEISGTPSASGTASFEVNVGGKTCTLTKTVNATTIEIGNFYQGGKIAYILKYGDPGYDPNKIKGLIVTTSDQGTASWGCYGTELQGADNNEIGAGLQNTLDILNGCKTANIAAKICNDLVVDQYDDWFLPSANELSILYTNRTIIGGFQNVFYWSSTEGTQTMAGYAKCLNFADGRIYGNRDKGTGYYVRAVRYFNVLNSTPIQ
jgi:uncharacterized repeat protein (TIGR02543 family)